MAYLPTELELEKMGLVSHTSLPKAYDWVTPEVRFLLLTIKDHGELGISAKYFAPFGEAAESNLLMLEVKEVISQTRDNRYCITWKGIDLADLIQKTSTNKTRKTYIEPPKKSNSGVIPEPILEISEIDLEYEGEAPVEAGVLTDEDLSDFEASSLDSHKNV